VFKFLYESLSLFLFSCFFTALKVKLIEVIGNNCAIHIIWTPILITIAIAVKRRPRYRPRSIVFTLVIVLHSEVYIITYVYLLWSASQWYKKANKKKERLKNQLHLRILFRDHLRHQSFLKIFYLIIDQINLRKRALFQKNIKNTLRIFYSYAQYEYFNLNDSKIYI